MVDISRIQKTLEENNWKPVKSHPEIGYLTRFDIVEEKKSWYLADWVLLVKEVEILDLETAQKLYETYKKIEEEKRSWVNNKIIFFFIIADKVKPRAAKKIASYEVDTRDLNMKGETSGRLMIIDAQNNFIYGSLPRIPLDARWQLSEIKDHVEKALNTHFDYIQKWPHSIISPFTLKVIMIHLIFMLVGLIIGVIYTYTTLI